MQKINILKMIYKAIRFENIFSIYHFIGVKDTEMFKDSINIILNNGEIYNIFIKKIK